MNGPLSGIAIVEAGHMLFGPYRGMLLTERGAGGGTDVPIKRKQDSQ